MYAISTGNFKTVTEICHVEITHLSHAAFDITEKISFLVNNYLLHRKKFEKVNVCLLTTEFTMVPQAFAISDSPKSLLKFATGAGPQKKALQHSLRNLSFCFAVEQELLGFFERTFPNVSLRHTGAVNIDLFFSQHSLLQQDLFLSIGDGFMELGARRGQELLFYNTFNYETNEDVLYYLLFTMEQFGLDPLYVKLALSGERGQADELVKSIRRYIKQVEFCVTGPAIELSGELASLPRHYYFTLLNQHLCEL